MLHSKDLVGQYFGEYATLAKEMHTAVHSIAELVKIYFFMLQMCYQPEHMVPISYANIRDMD